MSRRVLLRDYEIGQPRHLIARYTHRHRIAGPHRHQCLGASVLIRKLCRHDLIQPVAKLHQGGGKRLAGFVLHQHAQPIFRSLAQRGRGLHLRFRLAPAIEGDGPEADHHHKQPREHHQPNDGHLGHPAAAFARWRSPPRP